MRRASVRVFAEALDLVDDAPEWRAANPLPVGRSALAEWVESDSGDGPGRLSRELPAATTHADAHVGIALHRAFSGSGGELWVLGMCRPQLAALTYADLEQMTYAQMEDMAFYVFDEPYVWLRGTHGRDVLDEVDRVTRWYRATLLGKRFAGRPRGKGEFADVAAFLTDLKVALDAHGRELTQGEFADTRGTTARTVREWTRRARESHGDCLAFVNFPELVHALRGISAEELRSRIH